MSNKLEKQRQEAFIRIDKKLDILEQWLNEGIPFKLIGGNKQVDANGNYVLEYFPTSVRGLRLWNGENNSYEVVKKYQIPQVQTSDQAWKAAPKSTHTRVGDNENRLSIFVRLREKAAIQRSNKQKTKIDELDEKLSFSETSRAGLATELVQLRLENKSLENELIIAETRLRDAKHVMSQQLEFKNKAIQQLDNHNKTLKNMIRDLRERLIDNNIDISDIEKENSVISFPVADNDSN